MPIKVGTITCLTLSYTHVCCQKDSGGGAVIGPADLDYPAFCRLPFHCQEDGDPVNLRSQTVSHHAQEDGEPRKSPWCTANGVSLPPPLSGVYRMMGNLISPPRSLELIALEC